MIKRQVFYSFHYDQDVMRVQQVRNIGALDDNKPVAPNNWEQLRRSGDGSIQKWIDDNMKWRSCVVVLVGAQTASRRWVKYEIKKAWEDGKGLLAVRIHNLKCPRNGFCTAGPNPFDEFKFKHGDRVIVPRIYTPNALYPHSDIAENLENWIDEAIQQRR